MLRRQLRPLRNHCYTLAEDSFLWYSGTRRDTTLQFNRIQLRHLGTAKSKNADNGKTLNIKKKENKEAIKMKNKKEKNIDLSQENNNNKQHISVLLNEVIEALDPRPGGIYVDATFGRGGHTRALLGKFSYLMFSFFCFNNSII